MTISRSNGRIPPDSSQWPYEAPPSADTRLGISLSGGGVRSATFSLGVYQRLAEAGIFQRARYMSAVSGGSYLAAGLAISRALSAEGLQDATPHPWTRGSAEEGRLRRNLSYLAPGVKGRIWLFANVLYGLILNLTPLLLSAFLGGRVAGLLLREIYPGLGRTDAVDWTAIPWVLVLSAALVFLSICVVGARRFQDKAPSRGRVKESTSERWVMLLISASLLVIVLGIALPALLHVLGRSISDWFAEGLGIGDASWRLQRLLLGSFAVCFALGLGGIAVWLFRRRRLPWLRAVLAAASGIGVLLVPFVLAAETAAVRDVSLGADGPVLLGALLLILAFAVLAHNRRYSMHLFYRERLQEAFASRRVPHNDPNEDAPYAVVSIPYEEPVLLSDVAERNAARSSPAFPELIVCAAVAARGTEVPNKTWAASFTFEGEASGNARLKLSACTKEVESGDWIGGGGLTLPALMAISGAAVSPLMGRFTLPAFRFLMAVLNIRLGVWIRNPNRPIDETLPPRSQPLRRLWRYIVRGWWEPGAWYVLKEGLGLADTDSRYIYVSDGGHWENLGLTELLRRRCTHIVVVDASGDPGLGDIGRAIAVARAELGVEVRLDPRPTSPGRAELAESPFAVGSFRYPDGQEGDIYYARSVLWESAPSDLHLFAAQEHPFPNHPMSNQFLTGELFDAYRALGWAVGEELVSAISLPPASFDERRSPTAADVRGDAEERALT
jgi:Patatin-like phospholipase